MLCRYKPLQLLFYRTNDIVIYVVLLQSIFGIFIATQINVLNATVIIKLSFIFTQRAPVASNVPTGTAVVWPSHLLTLFTEAATAHAWCREKLSARPRTLPSKNRSHRMYDMLRCMKCNVTALLYSTSA